MKLRRPALAAVVDVYFGPDPGKGFSSHDYPGVDVVNFLQSPAPVPGASVQAVHTILIDLTQDACALKAALNRTARNEISRARRTDQLTFEFWRSPDSGVIERFCDFFASFAARKGLLRVKPAQLHRFAKSNRLMLSQVSDDTGRAVTWHAYFVEKKRARLIHSASRRLEADRSRNARVGRANRFHHWQDILRLKEEGAFLYDWGGVSPGTADVAWRQISEFKEKFGGLLEKSYNCRLSLTLKGKVYLLARESYYRLRARLARRGLR